MTRLLPALALLALAAPARAVEPPGTYVPPPVLMELRQLERQFDAALTSDCAPEKCFSKGCFYRNHIAQDLPREASMPGLGTQAGPGSVPLQEYLTEAHCEFTYEKSVKPADVQVLQHRLEKKLTKGWLKVTVGREELEKLPKSLAESPNPPEDKPALPPLPPAPPPEPEKAPEPPPTWDSAVALRELWVSLLPHFSWMIAVVMGTIAILFLIWAARRLGRETLEEKALARELAAGGTPKTDDEKKPAEEGLPPSVMTENGEGGTDPFVAEQQRIWGDRIKEAELASDEGLIAGVMRDWLRDGEFPLITKAIFLFGDHLSVALPTDGELAARKVELADYLRSVDEKALPSDAEFFRRLNQHAISSSLLSQADAAIYLSLREEFGASGVAHVIGSLPPRLGGLLFAMVPPSFQQDVARFVPAPMRAPIAEELLGSNRMSREDASYLFEVIQAARSGKPLPPAPAAKGIRDRGREIDAAGAVSVLLPRMEPAERKALFARALERHGGTYPRWYEDILFADMLLKFPPELQKDMLLGVDLRNLAGWTSLQPTKWQEGFVPTLAPTMQKALRSSMIFASRNDQVQAARKGHEELVAAVKKQLAQGTVSFTEIVA